MKREFKGGFEHESKRKRETKMKMGMAVYEMCHAEGRNLGAVGRLR
jgi:hypothetical protein